MILWRRTVRRATPLASGGSRGKTGVHYGVATCLNSNCYIWGRDDQQRRLDNRELNIRTLDIGYFGYEVWKWKSGRSGISFTAVSSTRYLVTSGTMVARTCPITRYLWIYISYMGAVCFQPGFMGLRQRGHHSCRWFPYTEGGDGDVGGVVVTTIYWLFLVVTLETVSHKWSWSVT